MTHGRPLLAAALALTAASLPATALAQANEADMAVTAEVTDACTVSATPMNFGMVTGQFFAVRTTATIQLSCAPRVDYQISMDRGLNAQGRRRRMANATGTAFLRYDIYSNPGYSQEWDDRGGGRTVSGNSGPTGNVSHTAYGQIPILASLFAVAPYRDTVVVTVEF
jgi:spore coat protein U-like protein